MTDNHFCSDSSIADVLDAALDVVEYGYASDYRVALQKAVASYREHVTATAAV